ncbi:Uncharacterized protein PBTT_01637 [Plasmodiophora brassicae]|uniref:Uncharacterized protein n=1 Tax=Plasmodiophora brassicae TaxID=37360 RepID=A0A0G4IIQ4_PLABS|nr:hypothetical protein PBRA_003856 [Plasmodiophora brassicae]
MVRVTAAIAAFVIAGLAVAVRQQSPSGVSSAMSQNEFQPAQLETVTAPRITPGQQVPPLAQSSTSGTLPISTDQQRQEQQENQNELPSIRDLLPEMFPPIRGAQPQRNQDYSLRVSRVFPTSSLNDVLEYCAPSFRQDFTELYTFLSEAFMLILEYFAEHEPVPACNFMGSSPFNQLWSLFPSQHVIIQASETRSLVFLRADYNGLHRPL